MITSNSDRAILHMDLDAFFVSVEIRRDSRLAGIPLIIGGKNGRGVVAACSYEARQFGIHSAMPMKQALLLCPGALVISGDMEAYTLLSREVTEIIQQHAPLFEKSSIDEFYLDLSGMDKYFGTYKWASELRQTIMHEARLPISMGLSINKLVSKVATNESKPNGQLHIPYGQEIDFLDPLPIEKIPMIGKKTTALLNNMGITKVKALRETPLKKLEESFGRQGSILWNKAHGIDNSPVIPYHEQKSISTETTFGSDTINISMIQSLLTAMVEKLAFKLRKQQKLTSCIAIKIRYANFDTVSRQMHIPYTSSDKNLIAYSLELFDKLYSKQAHIRLVGVRICRLVYGNYQINLFDDTEEEIRLFEAMDYIKHKYGPAYLMRATTLTAGSRVRYDYKMFSG